MCMASMPDMPDPPKPEATPRPPKPRDDSVLEAGARERRRAGRGTQTILTGPRGTSGSASTTGASVLSGTR